MVMDTLLLILLIAVLALPIGAIGWVNISNTHSPNNVLSTQSQRNDYNTQGIKESTNSVRYAPINDRYLEEGIIKQR